MIAYYLILDGEEFSSNTFVPGYSDLHVNRIRWCHIICIAGVAVDSYGLPGTRVHATTVNGSGVPGGPPAATAEDEVGAGCLMGMAHLRIKVPKGNRVPGGKRTQCSTCKPEIV